MTRVLIIGGYGNFGRFISKRLALESSLQIIVAGRNYGKAQILAEELNAEAAVVDINHMLRNRLKEIKPDIVIHTSGPFQSQGYEVAEACIDYGAHYIDLADAREFVSGIYVLNDSAKQAGITVVSGASSVPCLTSALIEYYSGEFERIESVNYGITTAQKTTRGVATTAAILSYTGHPFKTLINGKVKNVYGWQDIHFRKYKGLGWRLLGNCNVPDLDIFPDSHPELKTIRFYAGLELPFIHVTLWGLSWLVRIGLIKSLKKMAPLLLRLSFLFDWLGTDKSGFYMQLQGKGKNNADKTVLFELIAKSGDGPYIPCMPAILVAKKLANRELREAGAGPCVGMISKQEYLEALEGLDIRWVEY